MNFRKHTKKSLWGEELENDNTIVDEIYKNVDEIYNKYTNGFTPSFDLFKSISHYAGKKYECNNCGVELENNGVNDLQGTVYCALCYIHQEYE